MTFENKQWKEIHLNENQIQSLFSACDGNNINRCESIKILILFFAMASEEYIIKTKYDDSFAFILLKESELNVEQFLARGDF